MNYISKKYWMILYTLCCDYHSGQYSRGYRLLCKLRKYYDLKSGYLLDNTLRSCRNHDMYKRLEKQIVDKL